ncbi:MAG: nuclear transport factor 2 family protein [Oxalobacteraceae bacterium]|jgi:ketosteroid isomerase-like protein|nr:nuclear transport factor 2 family protein [Oxalobacteraceae bacterium]MCE2831557.1 nuclear transport factor 2 family protein [Oxalobacteraceae bacterium]
MKHQADLYRVIDFFQSISADSARTLSLIYTDDVWFKDPFNEVQGLEQVSHIFTHMFEQVDAPRFVVTHSVLQDDQAFLTWDFLFRMRRFSDEEQCIRGATHVRFASDGRVAYHRDYWDAAEELYEKLPVVGSLMRWLKTRARN